MLEIVSFRKWLTAGALLTLILVDIGCGQVTQELDGLATFKVTPSSTAASIDPNAVQTVSTGTTQSFAVAANSGLTLSKTVGGTCPTGSWSGTTYTTGLVSSDCTVSFVSGYALSVSSSGSGGSVSANNGAISACTQSGGTCTDAYGLGSAVTLTATPDAGKYASWSSANAASCSGNTCSFSSLGANQSVSVAFNALPNQIYVYETGSSYSGQNVGSRPATSAVCQSTYNASYSGGVSCGNFVALLGYSADNGILYLPYGPYDLPTSVAFKSVGGTTLASSWDQFLISNGSPVMTGTGFSSISIWNGFLKGGALNQSIGNCTDWTSGGFGGGTLQINFTSANWTSGGSNCTAGIGATLPYFCLCW